MSGAVDGLTTQPPPQKISIGPGDGKSWSSWNIAVPDNRSALKYHVDAVRFARTVGPPAISQQIIPAVPVRTWQATLVHQLTPAGFAAGSQFHRMRSLVKGASPFDLADR